MSLSISYILFLKTNGKRSSNYSWTVSPNCYAMYSIPKKNAFLFALAVLILESSYSGKTTVDVQQIKKQESIHSSCLGVISVQLNECHYKSRPQDLPPWQYNQHSSSSLFVTFFLPNRTVVPAVVSLGL